MVVSIVLLFIVCGGFFYWRYKLRLAEGARVDGKEVRSVRYSVKEDCEFICVSQEWLIDYIICFLTICNGSWKLSRKRRKTAVNEELTDSDLEDLETRKKCRKHKKKELKTRLDFIWTIEEEIQQRIRLGFKKRQEHSLRICHPSSILSNPFRKKIPMTRWVCLAKMDQSSQ
jgi:hypothetical protein